MLRVAGGLQLNDTSAVQNQARKTKTGLAAILSAAAALVLATFLGLGLWFNNHQQGRQNTFWLTHYAGAVAQILASDPDMADVEFLRVLAIPELRSACVYLNQILYLQTQNAQGQPCPDHQTDQFPLAGSAGPNLSVHISFQHTDGRSGLLLLTAADQRPPLAPSLALLVTLLLSVAGAVYWNARWYLQRQQALVQARPMTELKQFFQTLHRTQNYRLRAPVHPTPPYKLMAEMVNQMLDELQANENQIHEFAVQIQEKNDQLAAQQRLHQDRNQNLHKMFAGASHDLRQPLQAMTIFVGAVKEHSTAAQEPLLQKLEQVVDNLNLMFTDLLDISKLESRMTRIPKQQIAIQPLLARIYDEFEALANEKRIELRLYNRDLSVYSNANMLERIIRNMLSNAIRYTRTGGVLIGCRKRANAVWIEVWDTGRGIPQEKLGEIFNEFVQIREDDSESGKGVGLGLFIVKRLAQLLDHSILVTSQLRRGTMFRIVAPAERAPTAKALEAVPPPPTTVIQATRLPGKVLLLDDDDTVRLALKQLLKSWGCDVRDWSRLEDAEDDLRQEPGTIDLIISDFQLEPERNGLDAISALRRQIGSTVPALLITGAQEPELIELIEHSQIPWLRKPVRPAKLRAILQALGKA
jgi:signal transduction histidine kinase/ActR/RegA family two-component response regulator